MDEVIDRFQARADSMAGIFERGRQGQCIDLDDERPKRPYTVAYVHIYFIHSVVVDAVDEFDALRRAFQKVDILDWCIFKDLVKYVEEAKG